MPSAQLIVSFDPDEQARNFGLLDQRYEQLSCGAFRGSVSSIGLESMTLFRESLHQSVHQMGCAPLDRITVAAPCEMSDEAYWNGRHIGPDAIIAFSPGREFELRSPRHAVCTGVSIDRAELSRGGRSDGDDELSALLSRDTWSAPQTERLGQRLAAVLDAVSAEPAMLQERAACAQLADEVLGLLVAHLSGAAEPERSLRQGNYPRIARRARELMVEHRDEHLSVQMLCSRIGCSRRSLQYAFENVYGVNPVTFLRTLRLNAVRRELRHPGAGTTVLDVAARQGFWHFPRFAQEYARMFGELPSATLSASRSQA